MSLVLITGGAGFIGSHLTKKLLAGGHRVRILDTLSPQIHGHVPAGLEWLRSEGVEFTRGTVTSLAEMKKALAGAEVVVHLAAETGTGQSMYEIARYNEVNTGGTAVLLDVLANDPGRTVRRIVLASSRSIYGEGAYECPHCSAGTRRYPQARSREQLMGHHWEYACPDCGGELLPVTTQENDPPRPGSIYAATKFAQEDLVRIGCSSLGIDFAILRLQNVYGEGQSLSNPYTGILSIFSTRIRRSQHLPIFEDGMETRDFVHVHDVARAFVAAVQHDGAINEVINVGTGIKTTVVDIASHLSRAFGAELDLVLTSEYRLGDIRHNFADITRLESVLGIVPELGTEAGMRRFASWVLTQDLPEDKLDRANAELKARKLMG